MVSVPCATLPPASPNKPSQARSSSTAVQIRVGVPGASAALPPRPPSAASSLGSVAGSGQLARSGSGSGASRAGTPAKLSSAGSLASQGSGGATPPAMSPASARPPPSSSKRMLAPNGQPRKIPLALDFNDGGCIQG